VEKTIAIEPVTARNLPGVQDGLAGLLRDVVNGGGTVGFLPPLSADEAAAYWRGVGEALAGGGRRLLVARRNGQLVGTAQLDLAAQTNGRHRAEVMKVLVREDACRYGLGRRLMDAVEKVAREEGRRCWCSTPARMSPQRPSTPRWATSARGSSRTSPKAPTAPCTRRSCSTRGFDPRGGDLHASVGAASGNYALGVPGLPSTS
jgi:GNAT superfamily N-acetyltransferase